MEDIKKKKFYSLEKDTTFKYLLKKESTRWFFEKIVNHYTRIDLEGYTFIDNELNSGGPIKDFRLDSILISPDKKHIVNLEMNSTNKDLKLSRNRLYLHKIAGNLLKEGEEYQEIKCYYVDQVNFNNFFCEEDKDVSQSTYQLVDSRNHLVIENFKIHNIYIPRNVKLCYTKMDEELKLFTCKSYEEMRKIANKHKELNKIVDEIEKLNREKYFGALYNIEEETERWRRTVIRGAREEANEIIEQAKEEVEQAKEEVEQANEKIEKEKERLRKIVKRMKEKNMSIEEISEITGLTREEIALF